MIPIINCMTSFYAGFVVFAMLGYIANDRNVDIDKVARSGRHLKHITYYNINMTCLNARGG